MTAEEYLDSTIDRLREYERAAYAQGDTDRAALLEALILQDGLLEHLRAQIAKMTEPSLLEQWQSMTVAERKAATREIARGMREAMKD